jgi:multicomponent K+:H+ antiporter subunit E
MIRRWLPYPLLSLSLVVMWLLLTGSVAPRTLVFSALLALLVPLMLASLRPEKPRLRNPRAMIKLTGIVLYDIIRSNIAVGKIIFGLGHREKKPVSDFIYIPLDMQNSYGLAVLAIIITSTPGTLWVQYDQATGRLLMHILDLVDEEEWVRLIKGRYEKLLMEIFE